MKWVAAYVAVIIVACLWFSTHGNDGAIRVPQHFGFATVKIKHEVYLCTGTYFNCVKIYGPGMSKNPKVAVCPGAVSYRFCEPGS